MFYVLSFLNMSSKEKNSSTIAGLSAERAKALEAIEKYSFLHGARENSNNKSTNQRLALNSLENWNNVTSNNDESFVAHAKKTDRLMPIEFKPDEMNGRSTALQRNNMQLQQQQETFCKTSESFMNSKGHSSSFLGRPSVDQMFATSICGSLEFDDEDFQSGDLMSSRMKRDEMSYYEKYAHIPTANRNENHNESMFDGTFKPHSIGDYFQNENSLLQKLKGAPKPDSSPFALFSLTNNNSGKKTAKSSLLEIFNKNNPKQELKFIFPITTLLFALLLLKRINDAAYMSIVWSWISLEKPKDRNKTQTFEQGFMLHWMTFEKLYRN